MALGAQAWNNGARTPPCDMHSVAFVEPPALGGGPLTAVKGTEGFILTAARIESGQQSHRSCALQRGWARMSYVQQYIQPGSDPQPWGDVRAGLHTPQQTAQVPGAGTGQHFVESVAQL